MIAADARSGSTVGKYRLHEVIGRGGMGVVYRAEHVYIGREVAVKILHEGYGGREEAIKRFLREARAASSINHPNIVDVTDFGKASDGTVFFVMELLVGEPLDTILVRDRRLDLLRTINICNQLAAALAAAHHKGIIHRDLKPENVMLIEREGRRELVRRVSDESGPHEIAEREKKFDFVKILDFGVAKVREPDAEQGATASGTAAAHAAAAHPGVVFGTPEYMAPETARIGYSDARSDIYALGIMFYEMLTGTVPFRGNEAIDVMLQQVNAPVPPMSEVAPDAEITIEAERMILKALSKDPDLRHQTMEEFYRELQRCYGQLRFRRTLRTPSPGVASGAVPNVPASIGPDTEATLNTTTATATATGQVGTPGTSTATPTPFPIPLTKLKRAHKGALPTHLSGAEASAGARELVLDASLLGSPAAQVPELASAQRRPAQPILLTRRKPARSIPAPEPAATAPGATPTEIFRAGATPSAITLPAPAEPRKRTTLPLHSASSAGASTPTSDSQTSTPSPRQAGARIATPNGRPPGTPPLPLWGTDMREVPSPPRARPVPWAATAGAVAKATVSDRATPRVKLDPRNANRADSAGPAARATSASHTDADADADAGAGAGAGADAQSDTGAGVDGSVDAQRPAWFDGPTVVRNPLSVASLRDLKPQNDS